MSKRDELKKLRSAQKTPRNNDTPAEDYSKNAAEALAAEEKEQEAAATRPASVEPKEAKEAPAPATEQETPVEIAPEMPEEDVPVAEKAASYSIANEPGKRISVSLKTENKNWMHRTAMRCGLSIQDYINVLINEAWEREQAQPFVPSDDDPLPERIPSSKTVLVAIKLTNANIDRTKRMRASHCMTMTYYMNYLIEEEIAREQKEGMRRPVFDE